MSLPDLAIRRPVFIVVVFLIVALMGGISFLNLPRRPDAGRLFSHHQP